MTDTGHQLAMEVQYLEQHADPAADAPDLTAPAAYAGPLRVVGGDEERARSDSAAYRAARIAGWRRERERAERELDLVWLREHPRL